MRHWKIDDIVTLLTEAGEIALASWAAPQIELKSDQTVVTNADRAIERMFAERFDRPAEGSFMIGEESVGTRTEEYLNEAFRGICHVIDPIDGTAPYSAHVPLWGISIGRMEKGVLTEGAIYMPVDDEALLTCRGTLFSARGLQSGTPEVEPFQPRRMELSPAGHICIPQQGAKLWRFDLPNQVFAWSTCVGCYYALELQAVGSRGRPADCPGGGVHQLFRRRSGTGAGGRFRREFQSHARVGALAAESTGGGRTRPEGGRICLDEYVWNHVRQE